MLKGLCWNVCGLHDQRKETVRTYILEHHIDICCLQETKLEFVSPGALRAIGGGRLLDLRVLPTVGASGGIIVAWNSLTWRCTVECIGSFSVLVRLEDLATGWTWACSGVYGPHDEPSRAAMWAELSEVKRAWGIPWCCMGDFNVTRWEEDRNRSGGISSDMRLFSDWIGEQGLIDLPISQAFTWSSLRADASLARLDRVLVDIEWEDSFPSCSLRCLPRVISDHCPILLLIGGSAR
ncbi:hypothetical protein QJS10_CPB18g00699 [Acorus calamus]|uniref:Endonuclease/exonuclease/phosphatase domain-containing protein n=1 Tax=Acorus calamus TaxID=4465 RepID=A0AAV9CPG5_ACOCL|nr:hypothetical protein QJS10_CPB18g00699 [Acorus calamus]